jgi:hypothetical protein
VARYILKYSAASVCPSGAFPARTSTLRPYLAINLLTATKSFACYALIDSGADDCIFPASFAAQLGIDYLTGRHYPFGGVGKKDQDAYFFDVEMDIVGIIRYQLAIGFTTSLEQNGHGLLGQNGFFDRFSLGFHHPRGVFALYTP